MRGLLVLVSLLFFGATVSEGRDAVVPSWATVSPRQRQVARRLSIPVAFQNKLGMRFVLIPAGTFSMGEDLAAMRDERPITARAPRRRVTLTQPYYMQMTETSMEQYFAVKEPKRTVPASVAQKPMRRIAKWQAVSFAKSLSKIDNLRNYRLPTEAEWERACRAGRTSDWYWGDDQAECVQYENFVGGSDGHEGVAPVGSYQPNSYGLYDMLGNVAEWVRDSLAPPYPGSAVDPTGPRHLPDGMQHLFGDSIARGGTGGSVPDPKLMWRRGRVAPGVRANSVGVRLVVPVGNQEELAASNRMLRVEFVEAESGSPSPLQFGATGENRREVALRAGEVPMPPGESRFVHWFDQPSRVTIWRHTGVHLSGDPSVKRGVLRVPVYRSIAFEAKLALHDDVDRESIAGHLKVANYFVKGKWDALAGTFRVLGVPWIAGAPFELRVEGAGMIGSARGTISLDPTPVRIESPIRLELRPPSGGGPQSESWGESEGHPILEKTERGKSGKVLVACRSATGSPLPGAVVLRSVVRDDDGTITSYADVAFSDDLGTAEFPFVPVGESSFELLPRSGHPATGSARVRESRTARVSLRCPKSATVTLAVRRPEGGPAAWARVSLTQQSGRAWVNVDSAGVEHVSPTLDHRGRYVLRNVEPGRVTIAVDFHGRVIKRSLELMPDEQRPLNLKLEPSLFWKPGQAKR